MNLGLHELGPLAMKATKTIKINSTCTVFAGAELRDRLVAACGVTHGPGIVFNTKRPITSMADLSGLKFRIGGGMVNDISKALGMNVTVCARRAEQRAVAESFGLRGAALSRLDALAPAFDTVVNTVPARVLTAPVLAALRPGSLIIDLASKPGGTDFDAARRLGHKAIHALSLPAVCAPETAGEAVAHTVLTILREREERA